MIPGTYIRDTLGYCDGTQEWFERWVDLITRAPKVDDEDPIAYARAHGLNVPAIGELYGRFPPWWDIHIEGMPTIWSRVDRRNWARTTQPLSSGCTVLVPYEYRGASVGEPAPTDSCAYAEVGTIDDVLCNGSCKGRP